MTGQDREDLLAGLVFVLLVLVVVAAPLMLAAR